MSSTSSFHTWRRAWDFCGSSHYADSDEGCRVFCARLTICLPCICVVCLPLLPIILPICCCFGCYEHCKKEDVNNPHFNPHNVNSNSFTLMTGNNAVINRVASSFRRSDPNHRPPGADEPPPSYEEVVRNYLDGVDDQTGQTKEEEQPPPQVFGDSSASSPEDQKQIG